MQDIAPLFTPLKVKHRTLRNRVVMPPIGQPLDSPTCDAYYAFCEAEKIPILFHVADPPDLWDPERVPERVRKRGWFYGDGTYPALEMLYGEVDGILGKFPTLHVILAHFYFMSCDIERAARFLDTWCNVSFDLTSGGDMYVSFSKDPGQWREFFVQYQDQILFGTDNSGGNRRPNPDRVPKARYRFNAVRRFLEAVEFIIDLLAQGWTDADIVRNYPGLCQEDIHACLHYANTVLKAEKVYAFSVPGS